MISYQLSDIQFKEIITPVGKLYLGVESDNLCYVSWVNPSLVNQNNHFSNANSTNEILREAKKQLTFYFEGKLKKFSLPHKQEGTLFQKKVWEVIEKISFGSLLTYQKIARLVGSPLAYRAVGSACGSNQISVIVPCHRIVGAGNSLGGYTGGLDKKKMVIVVRKTFIRFYKAIQNKYS